MEISPGMEVAGTTNDVLLQLLWVHTRLGLDEQHWRRPEVAHHNAVSDKIGASHAGILLDSAGIAAEGVLGLDPIIIASAGDVSAWGYFNEEIAGMIVAVSGAERAIRTILGVRENDEL